MNVLHSSYACVMLLVYFFSFTVQCGTVEIVFT